MKWMLPIIFIIVWLFSRAIFIPFFNDYVGEKYGIGRVNVPERTSICFDKGMDLVVKYAPNGRVHSYCEQQSNFDQGRFK